MQRGVQETRNVDLHIREDRIKKYLPKRVFIDPDWL